MIAADCVVRQIKLKDLEQEALVAAQQESYREKELEQQAIYPVTLMLLLNLMLLLTLMLQLLTLLVCRYSLYLCVATDFTCVSLLTLLVPQLAEAQATVVTLGAELASIKTKLERAEEQVCSLKIYGQFAECAPRAGV